MPIESAPWITLAEYHKAEYLHEQGDIDLEWGPLNFKQSALDEFEEAKRDFRDRPHYHDQEDIDWLVPLKEPKPEYLIKLDENPEHEDD